MLSKSRKIATGLLFGLAVGLVLAYIPCTIWIINFEATLRGLLTLGLMIGLLAPAALSFIGGMYLLCGGKIRSSRKTAGNRRNSKLAHHYSH